MICMEQEQRSVIKGECLTLGQQAVYATLHDVVRIIRQHDIQVCELPLNFDMANKIPHWKGTPYDSFTNAQSIFRMLGAKNVYASDVSDYECPDFLLDLNSPVSEDFLERFDTIIDVGTLEHVFDIATALGNICKMVRVAGSIVLILPCSNAIDHGFYSFSPSLFFEYFGANGFSNMNCYLGEGSPYIHGKKGRVFSYTPGGKEIPIVTDKGVYLSFFGTKVRSCDAVRKPIQSIYTKNSIWRSERMPEIEPDNESVRAKMLPLIRRLLFHTKDFIPFWLEKQIYGRLRGKNLKFLGRY